MDSRNLELAKASRDGDVEAMEWLIRTLGCNPNAASHIGTPLVLAAYHGRFEAVQSLLKTEGKNENPKFESSDSFTFFFRNLARKNSVVICYTVKRDTAYSGTTINYLFFLAMFYKIFTEFNNLTLSPLYSL